MEPVPNTVHHITLLIIRCFLYLEVSQKAILCVFIRFLKILDYALLMLKIFLDGLGKEISSIRDEVIIRCVYKAN